TPLCHGERLLEKQYDKPLGGARVVPECKRLFVQNDGPGGFALTQCIAQVANQNGGGTLRLVVVRQANECLPDELDGLLETIGVVLDPRFSQINRAQIRPQGRMIAREPDATIEKRNRAV